MIIQGIELRPAKGFEDHFLVSKSGDVWSLKARPPRWLKPKVTPGRYTRVGTYLNGSQTTVYLHRLVMLAWGPDQPTGFDEVNHLNAVKSDNRVENLEWSNRSLNAEHAASLGLYPDRKGELGKNTKLTEQQVLLIRADMKTNTPQSEIGARYGVSAATISRIKNGHIWSHI